MPMTRKLLIKLARIAVGAAPRWKRTVVRAVGVGAGPGQEENHESHPSDAEAKYNSRMIACTQCSSWQETKWMQLRTKEGFRAVHCRTCGRQERALVNRCQCEVTWHHCPIHRLDPPIHKSRKGAKRTATEVSAEVKKPKLLSSTRQAPDIKSGEAGKSRGRKRKAEDAELKHSKFEASTNPPQQSLRTRIRRKEAEQNVQMEECGAEPNDSPQPSRSSQDTLRQSCNHG